jgi:hypothetical protein
VPSLSRQTAPHVGAWLLVAAVSAAGLAIGAINRYVLASVVVTLVASCTLIWWKAPSFAPRRIAVLMLGVLFGLTLITALQCVPLPRAVLAVVSPHAADIWRRAFKPLAEDGPRFVSATLDPSATRTEVLRGAAYILAFLAAWGAGRNVEALLQRALITMSSVVVAIAAIHYAFDVHSVYGLYSPRTGVSTISPFLNGNHLCAYGNIGLVLAYSSLLSSRPLFPKPILFTVVAACAATDIFFASRGAVAAMGVGVLLATLMSFRERHHDIARVAIPVTVALAGVLMLVLALFPASTKDLADTDLSKLAITKSVLTRMAPVYFAVGTGRGAFESTFPEFRSGTGFLVWTHPENIVAEWVSGWGVPIAVVAFVALAWSLRPRWVVGRRASGAWVAVVVTVLHNLVDFSLEIPAVALAIVVCMAVIARGTGSGSKTAGVALARLLAVPRLVVVVSGALALGALTLSLSAGPDLLTDRELVEHALRVDSADVPVLVANAIRRHPAEPYFPYAAGIAASRKKGENVLPWIEQTLERAPVYPPAHLVLARKFRRRAAPQARLEYRLYAEQNGGQPVDATELLPLVNGYDDALEATPSGKQGALLLEDLAQLLSKRLPATVARIDEETVARDPTVSAPRLREARGRLADLDEFWCQGDARCVDDAIAAAIAAESSAPGRCDAVVLHARALARRSTNEALALMRKASSEVSDRAACASGWAEMAIEAHRDDEATAALDALTNAPCSDAHCVDNLLTAVEIENRRGSRNRALVELTRASTLAPQNDAILDRLATQNAQMNLHVQAAAIFRQLSAKHPENAAYAASALTESRYAAAP